MRIEEIESIERSVLATLKIEGLKPSRFGRYTTLEYLNGNIDSRTAVQEIIKYHMKGK